MSTAAKWLAWQRRLVNRAGPWAGHNAPEPIAPGFPPTLRIQIAPGADPTTSPATWGWQDVTDRARYTTGVTITVGRRDEVSPWPPARCSMVLDNSDGYLSPRRPSSPWYGQITQGTPLRVLIDLGTSSVERFMGYMDEVPLGRDAAGVDNTVPVTAQGVLRRLGQGGAPTSSAIRRAILAAGPLAYWPLEDASGSTGVASAVSGQPPGENAGSLSYAADSTWPGSAPLAKLTDDNDGVVVDGTVTMTVNDGPTAGTYVVTWLIRVPAEPGDESQLGAFYTDGALWFWRLSVFPGSPATVRLLAYDRSSGVEQLADAGANLTFGGAEPWGDRLLCRIQVTQSGGNIQWSWSITNLDSTAAAVASSGTEAGTFGAITNGELKTTLFAGVGVGIDGATVGHFAVATSATFGTGTAIDYPPASPDLAYGALVDAAAGYDGERSDERAVRLATEAGLPIVVVTSDRVAVDGYGAIAQLGPQAQASLLALLRDAADADGGILYEVGGGLCYVTAEALYNQDAALTLDFDAGEVVTTAPSDTDIAARNDVTVTRTGGSSASATDAADITRRGRYQDGVQLGLFEDDQCQPAADWRLALGTCRDARWEAVRIDLRRNPGLIAGWLGIRPGSRVALVNVPELWQPDDADLLTQGWQERFQLPHAWTVDLYGSPARPWDVFVIEGSGNSGRLDSETSTLTTEIDAAAVSVSVTCTDGTACWADSATYPEAFPFDVSLAPVGFDGERVTVTAIAGTSSPQTFTITRAVNGVSRGWPAGTRVRLWRPGVIAR